MSICEMFCIRSLKEEGCPIHPICNGSSKGLTVRHGSFNPSMQNDNPSTGSHFARDLEKIHYIVMREGRNVVGPTGSSRSVSDGDDPSTGSHFAALVFASLRFRDSSLLRRDFETRLKFSETHDFQGPFYTPITI